MLTAERVVSFLAQLGERDLPDPEREELMIAVREVLLNAMEHGGGLRPRPGGGGLGRAHGPRHRVLRARPRARVPARRSCPTPPSRTRRKIRLPTRGRARAGLRPGGFGLLLARSIVDEMILSEQGNEVVLVKHTA